MPREHLRVRALTHAEINLADWHRFWRHGLFACAVGWMLLSVFALHWAISLLGIPGWAAWAGAAIYEASMAGTATSATTTRKPDGTAYPGPWLVFSFFMLIAQVCNVGHALVEVSGRMAELPPWVPAWVVYTFAGALAALFPLGGTMLVAMSGFLRAHGADAAWIDEDARTVSEHARARTPKPRTRADSDDHAPGDAHDDERAPEPPPLTLTDAQMTLSEIARACVVYDLATEHDVKLTAPMVRETAAITSVSDSQIRRWLGSFRDGRRPDITPGAPSVEEELSDLLAREDERGDVFDGATDR